MLDPSFGSDQDIPGLNILLDTFKCTDLKIKYGYSSKISKE